MPATDIFKQRRAALLRAIGKNNIGLIAAAPEVLRNGDAHYRYRQNSDFYYLTGFQEPEAVAVFIPGREAGEYVLFNRRRDRDQEIWTGFRAGQEGAETDFGVDQAFPIDELSQQLPTLLANCKQLYYPIGRNKVFDKSVMDAVEIVRGKIRTGINAPEEFLNIEHIIHDMRLYKSAEEIACLQKAADISVDAHKRAMQACQPGMYEYELAAEIHYECLRQGCAAQAYDSIVGGGANACILHYIDNRDRLRAGDLVLIDAGGEYQNYAADITRTFPVDGRFSESQKAIYNLVLKAQLAAIDEVKPANLWTAPQQTIVRILTQGLLDLGILRGDLETLINDQAYRQFYMHNSGHWLGLDVHDAGSYKENNAWREFRPGMVLTVEPGLYISADATNVDSQWHNIGVRIEDDVLVTEDGCDVLTKNLVKTVADIEAFMGQ